MRTKQDDILQIIQIAKEQHEVIDVLSALVILSLGHHAQLKPSLKGLWPDVVDRYVHTDGTPRDGHVFQTLDRLQAKILLNRARQGHDDDPT